MIIADTHVHFHHCFKPDVFFGSALQNMARFVPRPSDEDVAAMLLLTESQGADFFGQLAKKSQTGEEIAGWSVLPTGEACSVLAKNASGDELFILAGRQIVTSEKLEVLALGYLEMPSDGAPFAQTIKSVIDGEGIAVLPWGFGKWSGERGRVIDQYLASLDCSSTIYLGDNGNRLSLSAQPKQFNEANAKKIWILPGSDPLPFAAQQHRVGSYGVVLPGQADRATPLRSFRRALHDVAGQPEVFGRREGLGSFAYYQIAMQLRKHLPFWRGGT